jgi:hypothetical protein
MANPDWPSVSHEVLPQCHAVRLSGLAFAATNLLLYAVDAVTQQFETVTCGCIKAWAWCHEPSRRRRHVRGELVELITIRDTCEARYRMTR